MIKRVLFIAYLVLALLQVYIYVSLSNQLFDATQAVTVDFGIFKLSNSILLFLFIIAGIIIGGINIILPDTEQDIQKNKKNAQSAADESTTLAEQINQEIQNKYLSKLEAAQANATTVAKSEKNNLEKILWHLCKETDLAQGLLYTHSAANDTVVFELAATYAFIGERENIAKIEPGIGVTGQVAKSGEPVFIREVPKGYLKVISGLGEASPDYLAIIPFKDKNNKVLALAELAGFGNLNTDEVKTLMEIAQIYFSAVLDKK